MRTRTQHSSLPVTINRFDIGLVSNRDPLHAPVFHNGAGPYVAADALIDGLNVEVTNNNTLARRPGFPEYCSAAIPSGTPLAFSERKWQGVASFLDTTTHVYTFNTTSFHDVYTKNTTAQSYFQQVGQRFFWADGTDARRYRIAVDGATSAKWGIAAPTTAPVVTAIVAPSNSSWAANTFYNPSLLIYDSNGNIQKLTTAGTTNGSAEPTWSTTPGNTTTDGTAVWTCQGTATRQTTHAYVSGDYIRVAYSVTTITYVRDPETGQKEPIEHTVSYTDFFKCTTAGNSSSTPTANITWAHGIGSKVTDGSVVWTNVGALAQWSDIGTSYLVSLDTFIVDANGFQQTCTKAGKSGSTTPSFSSTSGTITADNGTSWLNAGPISAANTGEWSYVYVYKSTFGDFGETYYHISAASPISNSLILPAGHIVSVSGDGSTDDQVTDVDIYRTKQGGSVYYFLTSVSVTQGSGAAWSFLDAIPDDDLNIELTVDTTGINTPPPAGAALVAFFQGRIWLAVANKLYYDAGGDCQNGDPHQSFPPANVFTYPTDITALSATNEGLVVSMNDESYVVLGGPGTTTFYTIPLFKRTGVKSQNAVQQDQDTVYLLTSQGQGISFSAQSFDEFGTNVGDKLISTFPPESTYLALHRNGPDIGIFVSDGSTNILRFNPVTGAWSSIAQPVGGVGPIASLETSTGVYTLLTTIDGYICGRSLTTFSDGHSAQAYAANATIGSLDVAGMAGPSIAIRNAYMRTTATGSRPAVSILQNNTSGTFSPVQRTTSVPAKLNGTAYESGTVRQDRYDLNTTSNLALSEFNHLQLKVSWPTEAYKNELIGLAIGDEAQ